MVALFGSNHCRLALPLATLVSRLVLASIIVITANNNNNNIVLAVAPSSSSSSSSSLTVEGEEDAWDRVFASREPTNVIPPETTATTTTVEGDVEIEVPVRLVWTEGPVHVARNNTILFSDTIGDRLYEWSIVDRRLRVLVEGSGDGPDAELGDRQAEPGSNGLALWTTTTTTTKNSDSDVDDDESRTIVLVCQHGARRLAAADAAAVGARATVVDSYRGRRLNGPNDVAVRTERDGVAYAYFTDPVYAFLEKDRFYDAPYLDRAVETRGAGATAAYRVALRFDADGVVRGAEPERVFASPRPNGVGLLDDDSMVASDCCQSDANDDDDDCLRGTSRWTVYERPTENDDDDDRSFPWRPTRTIEDRVGPDEVGCADGFAVLSRDDDDDDDSGASRSLAASCVGGLCLVDLAAGAVVARLRTGWRVSNAAVVVDGDGDQMLWLTGERGVWTLPLRRRHRDRPPKRGADDDEL